METAASRGHGDLAGVAGRQTSRSRWLVQSSPAAATWNIADICRRRALKSSMNQCWDDRCIRQGQEGVTRSVATVAARR
ncbi:hypothetical protein E2562_018247 [Oryza meyeriana var. granulata]|uniref:Uncharacterized protein n=1 Tax=Oryza meyeriana var. granulata TaxID=110450 RepID=A0A6G1CH36_9ORYZ|nr:hypothetical protein E2562_018247 [Oryza meyeriana var. granulata]